MNPLDEFIWCTECCAVHDFDPTNEWIYLAGEPYERRACAPPTRVRKLPEGWDTTYDATYVYHGDDLAGYDLWPRQIKVRPRTHYKLYTRGSTWEDS